MHNWLPQVMSATGEYMQGNTKEYSNGTYSCQHGVDECITDSYELCTLYKLSGDLESINRGETSLQAFPFIQCMEQAEGAPSAASGCFSKTMANSGLSWSTVTKCADEEYAA